MTLLIEADIDGVKKYISNEPIEFGNRFYDPYVIKMGSVKVSSPQQYGGYARLTYSDFTLSPDFFESEYPTNFNIKVGYTEDDNIIDLFDSVAHISNISRTDISYRLFGSDYSEVLTDQSFTGTLVSIFQTYTGSSHLNVNLDVSLARSPSPDVNYTASGELLKILSDIAAFFGHIFYIQGNTLYLIDAKHELSLEKITEFDYLVGAKYRYNKPYNLFKSGNYSVAGSYPYGDELNITPTCHNTQSNIETAINDVKKIIESRNIELPFPFSNGAKKIGDRLRWTDESLSVSTDFELLVTSITYNFDKFEYTCQGNGYKA